MRLLIDIGNSSICWATEQQQMTTDRFDYVPDQLYDSLKTHIPIAAKLKAVLVSNVAGEAVMNTVKEFCQHELQCAVWQARTGVSFDELTNSYVDVSKLGIDRWLAMIAAWDRYRHAICIVDCGTAMTIDFIMADGMHAGGLILPGHALMQHSLIRGTEQIQSDLLTPVSMAPANNTQDAISNAASLALIASIEMAITRFNHSVRTEVECILTGGMGKYLNGLLTYPHNYDGDLILHGLGLLYNKES